uniref:Uncharacterized protein n=1 Tax=Candidatus Kentrum sp. TUN TaxID=2126343 RepID=A0A450ZHM0_9GAMM|nr:MAG: hypothetical protein BECKTUN1418F_GA0071002_10181 [Candidatus Kentron sp. TUN]VFK54042.1 MAG: hypothetical protein BECKTUN1418E_GA0071001_10201 [Candidatus Kentron sp. TUN]
MVLRLQPPRAIPAIVTNVSDKILISRYRKRNVGKPGVYTDVYSLLVLVPSAKLARYSRNRILL